MINWWANLPESDYSHYDNFFYMYFVPKDKEDFRSLGLLLSFLGISYAVWKLYPRSEKIQYIKEYLAYKFNGPQYACGVNLDVIYQLSNEAKRKSGWPMGVGVNVRLMDKIRIISRPYYKKKLGLVVDYNMVDHRGVNIDNMSVTSETPYINYYLLHFSAYISNISMEILRVRDSTSLQEFNDQFISSIPCKLLRSHFVKFDTNCSELTQDQADNKACNGDEDPVTMHSIDYRNPSNYYIFHDSKHCIDKKYWPELINSSGYMNPWGDHSKPTYCN